MSQRSRFDTRMILPLILLLGTALRLYKLGSVSFWFDEAISVLWTNNLASIFKPAECAPPLFFTLLYGWRSLFSGDFLLRLLPALFGIGTIAVIYLLGKAFFGRRAALFAAFILAVSPFHIFYSQELTVYSLLAFTVSSSLYCLKMALDRGKWGYWTAFSFFTALSLLTHYTALFAASAQALFLLAYSVKNRQAAGKAAVSFAFAALFISPWLRLAAAQLSFAVRTNMSWWVPSLPPSAVVITLKNFSVGYSAGPGIYLTASALFFLLFAAGLRRSREDRAAALLLLCALFPVFFAWLLLKLGIRAYVDRYFLPSAVVYCLIVARGAAGIRNRALAWGALACIAAASAVSLHAYYLNVLPNGYRHHIGVQEKVDFKPAVSYIARGFRCGDGITHTNKKSILSVEYYFNRDAGAYPPCLSGEARRRLWVRFPEGGEYLRAAGYVLGDEMPVNRLSWQERAAVPLERYRRIWVVAHAQDSGEESRALEWMDARYTRLDMKQFRGLSVYLYDLDSKKAPQAGR